MSDAPGRVSARFNREAREALEETMRLCERADRLRADVARMIAAGRTPLQADVGDQSMAVEQLVDLVGEAAGLLGQATWFWAQTINAPSPS